MHLIDRLIAAAETLPPSHRVVQADVAAVLSALLAHEEHGDAFLDAADHDSSDIAGLPAAQERVAKLYAPEDEAELAAGDHVGPSPVVTTSASTAAEPAVEVAQEDAA